MKCALSARQHVWGLPQKFNLDCVLQNFNQRLLVRKLQKSRLQSIPSLPKLGLGIFALKLEQGNFTNPQISNQLVSTLLTHCSTKHINTDFHSHSCSTIAKLLLSLTWLSRAVVGLDFALEVMQSGDINCAEGATHGQ